FTHTSEFNDLRWIHTDKRLYRYTECHKSFQGHATIKDHLETHTGAPMYCCLCGPESSTLNLMSKHVGRNKGSLLLDFTVGQIFLYLIHCQEAEKNLDS
ncbi:zinc finger and btb, partial [Lynx pardinus]